MSSLKDQLAEAWAEDLQGRVPAGHRVFPMRRPRTVPGGREVEPPFTVLTVLRMEQTTPASNVWEVDVRVVVVCDKDQGDSVEQKLRVGQIYRALEATPVPCADEPRDVRLFGFMLEEIEQAAAEKVHSDVIFIRAGAGDLASAPDALPL